MPLSRYLTDRYTGRALIPGTEPVRGDECECPPACPSCGGLECLCRPRFFAGQVLTEVDLNRLENYVIAKNKLHNRHFHGAGVVCGLEVVCDPCDAGSVIVKNGYALAPCGDDIIVCTPARVSVCDLIQRCKPRDQDCDPYGAQAPTECKDGIRQWILSICYDEKPSRGVQPLLSEPCNCGSSCGCGLQGGGCGCGSQSAGCGSGGKSTSQASKPAKSMSAAAGKYSPQCEPTLICEGFKFTATKYVDASKRVSSDAARYGIWGLLAAKAEQFGPLLSRLVACYLKAVEIRDAFADARNNVQGTASELTLTHNEYRDALREFAAEHVAHRCELARELSQLEAPRGNVLSLHAVAISAGAWQASFDRLNELWLELFRECFCSALLPPCPEVEHSDCVPLAVVTVDTRDCRVLEICNWSEREFALTLPTLYYWTSFMNWGAIKAVLAKLCCDPSTERWAVIFRMMESIVRSNAGGAQPAVGAALVGSALGMHQPSPTGAAALKVSNATLTALSAFLEQATMPDGMARLLSIAQPPMARASEEVAQLHETIQTLQRTVSEQGEQIRRLMEHR